jgi:hypothetical protein
MANLESAPRDNRPEVTPATQLPVYRAGQRTGTAAGGIAVPIGDRAG